MIVTLFAGVLTGVLAGRYLEGQSLGAIGDGALGLLGAIAAWLVVEFLGFGATSPFGAIITGFAGAILLRFGPQPEQNEEHAS